MKLPASILAVLILAAPASAQTDEPTKGERELAELIEGRVAGEPVRCLTRIEADSVRIIDETAFVFRDRRTIYINRPVTGTRYLDRWDMPVFRKFGSSNLCRSDQVELVDRNSGFPGPVLQLGAFIPYTLPETESPQS